MIFHKFTHTPTHSHVHISKTQIDVSTSGHFRFARSRPAGDDTGRSPIAGNALKIPVEVRNRSGPEWSSWWGFARVLSAQTGSQHWRPAAILPHLYDQRYLYTLRTRSKIHCNKSICLFFFSPRIQYQMFTFGLSVFAKNSTDVFINKFKKGGRFIRRTESIYDRTEERASNDICIWIQHRYTFIHIL